MFSDVYDLSNFIGLSSFSQTEGVVTEVGERGIWNLFHVGEFPSSCSNRLRF